MLARRCNAIALLTGFIALGMIGAWPLDDDGTAAATTTLSGCIAHAFPTAEAGFARQRTAAEG